MATVDRETGVITEDTEAEADAHENAHDRPPGWIAPTVEADGDGDGDTPEPEPEPEPAASAPQLSQKEIEAMGRKIDQAATTHENALRRILGEQFAEWMPCPLCMTDGHFQPMPADQRDPAQVAAVHAALGEDGYAELEPAPDLIECETCHGYGKVRTPSRSPGNETVNCNVCASRGYVNKPLPPVATSPAWSVAPPPPPPVPYQPIPGGAPDPWGKPAGHPQWGIDLNAVG